MGVGSGVDGGGVEDMGGWGWVPSFALEYVELIRVWLLHGGLTCFPSWVGSAGCYCGLYAGSWASVIVCFVGESMCGVVVLR